MTLRWLFNILQRGTARCACSLWLALGSLVLLGEITSLSFGRGLSPFVYPFYLWAYVILIVAFIFSLIGLYKFGQPIFYPFGTYEMTVYNARKRRASKKLQIGVDLFLGNALVIFNRFNFLSLFVWLNLEFELQDGIYRLSDQQREKVRQRIQWIVPRLLRRNALDLRDQNRELTTQLTTWLEQSREFSPWALNLIREIGWGGFCDDITSAWQQSWFVLWTDYICNHLEIIVNCN